MGKWEVVQDREAGSEESSVGPGIIRLEIHIYTKDNRNKGLGIAEGQDVVRTQDTDLALQVVFVRVK